VIEKLSHPLRTKHDLLKS